VNGATISSFGEWRQIRIRLQNAGEWRIRRPHYLENLRLHGRFDDAGSPPAGITVIIWKNPAGRKRKDGTCSIR